MAGLVPAIHAARLQRDTRLRRRVEAGRKRVKAHIGLQLVRNFLAWMAGTSPAMTVRGGTR